MANLFKRNNNTSYGYTVMEKEDPEERNHREAQFLIYKTLKQADQLIARRSSRSSSWLRLRISKLKLRIGKKLLRLRKTMLSNMAKTKMGVYKQVLGHLKTLKRLFQGGSSRGATTAAVAINGLPQPLFKGI
ncbi:uncharacterized protein LOC130815745 [Amaranthus tricolor]|uniref:uncharacterized protein LOC130815745 n=1 Tax=Amaranthus tricolor TaxID=29722 RepID=UPI00258E29E1|nr:uncharacterized protein LOC130815745 [Amaranthus tricolor]